MSIFEVGLHPKQEKPLKLSPYFIIQNTYAHDPIKIPKIRKKKMKELMLLLLRRRKPDQTAIHHLWKVSAHTHKLSVMPF